MQVLDLNTPYVKAIAGFSERTCSGGVLLWNAPTPQNGLAPKETVVQVHIKDIPLKDFKAEAFILDDRRVPSVSILLSMSVVLYP